MDRIKALRQRKADLLAEAEVLTAKEDEDELTEDEQDRLDELTEDGGDLDVINGKIAREERLMEERRSMEAIKPTDDDEVKTTDTVAATVRKDPEKFTSFGEQLQAVAQDAMLDGVNRDRRLIWGAPTGAGEAVPSDGGFLVQQDFALDLLNRMNEMGDVISRVRNIPISPTSNGLKLPAIDESSRIDGSRWGGVLAYWANEADTVTSKKPKFREIDMRLKKLFGLGYATDELLADGAALQSILTQAFTEELVFKTENAIINGTGAGQPLGLMNSGAVVTVSKESGQTADTVITANIVNMFARLPRRSARNAVWLINQDVWPQLWQLTLGTGAAVVLLYAPPGVAGPNVNSPFGTLLGRPVLPVEYCAKLGDLGDMLLVDLSQYLMIDKGGPTQASSMHVRFVNDEMTFRFIYRVDGQPAWNTAITPFKGSATQSPFITLAAR